MDEGRGVRFGVLHLLKARLLHVLEVSAASLVDQQFGAAFAHGLIEHQAPDNQRGLSGKRQVEAEAEHAQDIGPFDELGIQAGEGVQVLRPGRGQAGVNQRRDEEPLERESGG
ncbi:hypothetical protein D3C78_1404120 [compost metagenome]